MATATQFLRRTLKTWCMTTACLCLLSSHPLAHAQSVFRCGASYSNDANCDEGIATPLATHNDANNDATQPPSKEHPAMVKQMQKEADQLEKKRQRETHALTQLHTPANRHAPQTAARKEQLLNEQQDADNQKRRRKSAFASPYFTAKGKGEVKKP